MNASALAPLAFAAPLLSAAVIAAGSTVLPRRVNDVIAIVAGALTATVSLGLITAIATTGTLIHWFGGWTPRHGVALGISFTVDPIGGALAMFAAFLTLAALVFAWTFYDEGGPQFHILLLVFSAALIGFFLTGDLFNLFVFFELMSVSAYALTAFRTEDETAVMGALSFAVVNSTGAFLVLIGVVMAYARTGALNLIQIGHTLAAGHADPLVVTAFALIAFGFLVKASIVPAHFWLSEAHAVAPTPLCVLFSGIMVQAGIYAVARVYADAFSTALAPHAHAVGAVMLAFGLLTAAVGAIMCLTQWHLKRLFAFSTIAHSGIMLCGVGLLSTRALAGLVAYIVGHGLVKGALFMCSGIILNRWRTLDVEAMRGRLRRTPWLATLLAAGGVALTGLPLFATFAGKAMIDRAAQDAGLAWLPYALLLASAATGAAVLRALGTMVFGWGPRPDRRIDRHAISESPESSQRRIPVVMLATATALLVACVGLTFAPGRTSLPLAAAMRFFDRPAKLALTMQNVPTGPLHHAAPLSLRDALPLGAASCALAVLVALWALFGERVRSAWRAGRLFSAPLDTLRRAHSGVVTDYIVWLVGGTVAFTMALAFATHAP